MTTPTQLTTEITQFLTFAVADEEYALEILRVREILAYAPLTRVPRAPHFIAGVMNLRGSVVPVVDLRAKLSLPPTTITSRTCVVIVEAAGQERSTTIGLLADDVRDVMELAPGEMAPPPTFGTRIDLTFLLGMGDLGDHFALILDIDHLLSSLELIAAEAAVAEAQGSSPSLPDKPKRSSRTPGESAS